MRKAILCLIFATALLGQPTGVQVDLSVVSVDSSSGEVCFKADARPDGAIFDGTDDHITVPEHADLNFDSTGDFTIEAWFKADAVGRQNPIVCKLIGSNPNFTGYQMWIAPDNKLKAFICDGSYTLVASSSTITANTWYYAAFTVDRDGNEKIYLNGALDCTPVNVSGVGNINTDTTLWIGRATHSPTLAFDGTIAEVRISDVARTDAEIADAYTYGGSFENDANTIALWHLNEGSGTATGDSSGNGHTGTLTNGATWGNGVIVNPIPGATWTTGLLPTPPEFAYDYDWENDATYDLTDAGDSVCHTYTPGDSLWAKVQATTATYTAEDSAEVIVPEEEEYTFEVLMTEDDWEEESFLLDEIVISESGEPWFVGTTCGEYNPVSHFAMYVAVKMDTLGNIDTLDDYSNNKFFKENHIVRQFSSVVEVDTFYRNTSETTFVPVECQDSVVITPVFYDYPSWKFSENYIEPWVIGDYGWTVVYLWGGHGFGDCDYSEKDSLYPGWDYAITKDGNIVSRIEIGGRRKKCTIEHSTFMFLHGDTVSVFDSTGYRLLQKVLLDGMWYDNEGDGTFNDSDMGVFRRGSEIPVYPLEDGSLVYFEDSLENILLKKVNGTSEYSYVIPTPIPSDLATIEFTADYGRLAMQVIKHDTSYNTKYLYYFDIEDSIEFIWEDSVETLMTPLGVLPNGDVYFEWTQFSPFSGGIVIRNGAGGSVVTTWPESPVSFLGVTRFLGKSEYIVYTSEPPGEDEKETRILRLKGGE